ncbi:hypothetical protein HK104_005472 [Borealophlyctis nickersoniae]|nr:hypothetical protein HK104_005472 [Borealophlyctis nickersoniae]
MEEQLNELFSFLKDQRVDVRNLAVKNVSGLTASPEFLPYFKRNGCAVVKDLMECRKGDPLTAHDALAALVNLSSDPVIQSAMDDEDFIYDLIVMIVLPRNVLSDLCCMLLNNLSECGPILRRLIPHDTPALASPTSDSTPLSDSNLSHPTPSTIPPANPSNPPITTTPSKVRTHQLDNLLEVFCRGVDKKYNPEASYHFLAGVFANAATTRQGARFMLETSQVDGVVRLAKVAVFLEHPDRIRRAGAIATVKNTAFDVEGHKILLEDPELNLLPYLLLPLSGPEDYEDEEMEGMPDELQLLEDDKRREPDPKLRTALLETLLLLTTTRSGRDILRAKKVYPVIRKLHLQEQDENVNDAIERLVNMLMRDEQSLMGNTPPTGGRGKDLAIVEVEDSDSDPDDGADLHIEELL